VWFPGAYADIGGGYIAYDLRGSNGLAALDDITLDWMLRGVRASVGSSRRAFVNFASFRLPKYRQSARPSLLGLLLTVSTKSVDNPVENLK